MLVKQRLEYMELMLNIHNAAPDSSKGLEQQRKAVDDMVRYCKQTKVSEVSVSTALSVNAIIQQSCLAQIFKDIIKHVTRTITLLLFMISIIFDIYDYFDFYYFCDIFYFDICYF